MPTGAADLRWAEVEASSKLIVFDEAQVWPEAFPRLRSAIDAESKACGDTTVLRENDLEREASPWVFTLSFGEGADQRSHRAASERTPEASRNGRLSR